jgi:transketolase
LEDTAIRDYFMDGTDLKGLSDSRIPGLEVTSGSLGHGFSVGVGLAKAAHLRASSQRVYAIVGDGELNEGPIWEGLLFASHHQLSNLMIIVDANGFQAMGSTDEVLALGEISAKLESFGCVAVTVDGHDEAALSAAIRELEANASSRPRALVARTVKGKGVPFMEGDNSWHYTRLNAETYALATAAVSGTD